MLYPSQIDSILLWSASTLFLYKFGCHQVLEYSKKPCPCRNCTFLNEMHHQYLGSTRPVASCFLGTDDPPSWEMCNISMGMSSCFYPMTCKKHQSSHVEITHPFSAWIVIQIVSLHTGDVFKKLKHGSIIFGCWEIRLTVHLLFKHMHTSVDISSCNKPAP